MVEKIEPESSDGEKVHEMFMRCCSLPQDGTIKTIPSAYVKIMKSNLNLSQQNTYTMCKQPWRVGDQMPQPSMWQPKKDKLTGASDTSPSSTF